MDQLRELVLQLLPDLGLPAPALRPSSTLIATVAKKSSQVAVQIGIAIQIVSVDVFCCGRVCVEM